MEDIQDKKIEQSDKLDPNPQNGQTFESYSWGQNLQEIELKVPLKVDFKVKSKDLAVVFEKRSVKIGLKGELVCGEYTNCEPKKANSSLSLFQNRPEPDR